MALSKGALAIHQNGLIYDNDNIDKLLFERYISQRVRKAGGRTTNQKKRTKENDLAFKKAYLYLCEQKIIPRYNLDILFLFYFEITGHNRCDFLIY